MKNELTRRAARILTARNLAGICIATGITTSAVESQELLFVEDFETDGAGVRYVVEGGDVYEVDRIKDELGLEDQGGPVYWSRSSEVSFVGVPAPAPDKRAILAWHHDIPAEAISDGFFNLFDAAVAWLAGGKANATVLYAGESAEGDIALMDHLTERGYTVVEDDFVSDLDPDTFDLAIKSSSATTATSRFVSVRAPVLTFDGPTHDDELVSSIGVVVTADVGMGSIADPGHPAAGGIEGNFGIATGSQSINLIGDEIPGDATVVAEFERIIQPTVDQLATVDGMVAGSIPSTKQSGTLDVADVVGSGAAFGSFFEDEPLPGDPSGAFGTVALGRMSVATAGTYSIGLGVDDGGRLRIDLDQNGLTQDDDVLVEDASGGFRYVITDLEFPVGTFDFEWVAFNSGGDFGSELAVGLSENGNAQAPVDDFEWELLSADSGRVKLEGEIAVDVLFNDGEAETEPRPLLVVIESGEDGGSIFGGGPFAGFEGETFFAGSGLNKYDTGTGETKSLILGPIDVTGKSDLTLTFAAGATFLDFETSDFLDVFIDPDSDGEDEPSRLIHFSAPSADEKFFDDKATRPDGPTRLGLRMQDIAYRIPEGATLLTIRIDALTTWWNEIVAIDNIRLTAGGGPGKQGGTVVWLSESDSDSGLEFLELLRGDGHTATEVIGTDPTDEELEMINAADVVIFSRKTNSGSFNSEFWDEEITAPMIVLTPYVLRSSRWGWFDGDGLADATPDSIRVEVPDHPLFTGMPLEDGGSGAWHTEVDRGTSFNTDEVVNGGTLLASSDDLVVAAEWPAGAVASGRRILLSMGSREPDGGGTPDSGKFNLTPLGELALLNAVRIFTPATSPGERISVSQVNYDSAAPAVTITWTSLPNASYAIESSADLVEWDEVDDSIQSEGQMTTTSVPAPGQILYFRVRKE